MQALVINALMASLITLTWLLKALHAYHAAPTVQHVPIRLSKMEPSYQNVNTAIMVSKWIQLAYVSSIIAPIQINSMILTMELVSPVDLVVHNVIASITVHSV
jgi:hypothetical protein